MDTTILKAGHAAAHALSPVTGAKSVPLCGDTFDYNYFAFGLGHFKYTMKIV